jgi:predicted HTH domain antitoxin
MDAELSIKYPESLPDVLQETPEEFEQEAKMAMVAKLYERGRISSGVAAKIAGLDRITFLLQLSNFKVSMINLHSTQTPQETKLQ